jgi:alginate O-acetyltransferase complex protein AlgI
MLFTSGEFLFVFLPVTLSVFFATARLLGKGAAAFWLALASLAFYGYWRTEHVLLLVASIAFNYLCGELILKARSGAVVSPKAAVTIGVSVNLAALMYFKYADLLVRTIDEVSGARLPLPGVTLPLGISFFTFTQIAYLVDVYAGKVVERNPTHYALFATYFPHLIAGPVLHHSEMMPQFRLPGIYLPRLRNFAIGLTFLCVGLAKKVLVADTVAPIANAVFDNAAQAAFAASVAWLGVVAYTLQIYFDFSGYSDMAVGLSLLIGVRLPYNFNSPYQSWNITEFWRRWHMTLSRFLRDYLYIALGGNRHGQVRRYFNLLTTMVLGGLWHGASWTFALWGALHGIYLVINHGWHRLRDALSLPSPAPKSVTAIAARVAATALTLLCVMIGWVFFRAKDLATAGSILTSMFNPGRQGGALPLPIECSGAALIWMLVFCLIGLFGRNSQSLIDGMTRALDRAAGTEWQRESLAAMIGALLVGITLLAVIAASRAVSEFIYFNF